MRKTHAIVLALILSLSWIILKYVNLEWCDRKLANVTGSGVDGHARDAGDTYLKQCIYQSVLEGHLPHKTVN